MFIGHFAVGYGAKRFAPRAPLWALMAAPLWADILWTVFLLMGWEHARNAGGDTRYTPLDLYDYPWSHSLLMLVVCATVLGAGYFLWKREWAGAAAIWIGVVSHWVLDWITLTRTELRLARFASWSIWLAFRTTPPNSGDSLPAHPARPTNPANVTFTLPLTPADQERALRLKRLQLRRIPEPAPAINFG